MFFNNFIYRKSFFKNCCNNFTEIQLQIFLDSKYIFHFMYIFELKKEEKPKTGHERKKSQVPSAK
jgi:hypothetical protein